MNFCAQYGNHNSFYGNIELGRWSPVPSPVNYGAWPDDIPENSPMVNNYPLAEVADNIAIIRRLRNELQKEEDTKRRIEIRAEIEKAILKKEEAFRSMAKASRIDEEETTFILLN